MGRSNHTKVWNSIRFPKSPVHDLQNSFFVLLKPQLKEEWNEVSSVGVTKFYRKILPPEIWQNRIDIEKGSKRTFRVFDIAHPASAENS
jgi:hypothetical protein